MYCCGPTVYRDAHVGNLRTFLLSDLVRRVLIANGVNVKLIQNITDVGHMSEDIESEDKMLAQAKVESIDPFTVARKYEAGFHTDLARLNIEKADAYPRASESIELMLAMIEQLIAKEFAYVGEDGTVYFSAQAFPSYGAISGNRLDALKPGHRYEYSEDGAKRFHADWALWKSAGGRREMIWDSPWGPGFPGWHIECSAMAHVYLGESFDIHGGGLDLIFPHHENEIAQSNAAGFGFANIWMHNAWVTTSGEKMSKSLGNSLQVAEILKKVRGIELRWYLGSAHYRSMLEFSFEALAESATAFKRIEAFLSRAESILGKEAALLIADDFAKAMNDDLAVPQALAFIAESMRIGNSAAEDKKVIAKTAGEIRGALSVLGCDPKDAAFAATQSNNDAIDGLIKLALEQREAARLRKDFAAADQIRDQIASLGITVEDTTNGPRWSY